MQASLNAGASGQSAKWMMRGRPQRLCGGWIFPWSGAANWAGGLSVSA